MPSRAIVVLFCLLLSPLVLCAAPLQVDGLDSLSSATLGRALEILDVRPVELGFDKLYAPDDTFRFAIVEQLLGDPLRLPGWQDEVFAGLRGASGDAAALSTELHGLIEAAPGRGSAAGALQATGSWQRLREGLAAAETIKTWPVVIDSTALEPEMARLGAAAAKLERAFARLTPAEREQVLVLAPVIWADWEDPDSPDRNGKGKLHFEVGAAADTSITITADRLLTIATSVDRGALAEASREALDAFVAVAVRVVEQAAEEQEDHPRLQRFDATSPFRHMIRHMKGGVITSVDTPLGPLVVGGPGTNIYEPEALARIAFLIDVGGDDVYRGRVASALGGLTRPFSLVVDASGDDVYDASDRPYAIGSAIFGVAALIDLAGDDQYRGADGSCGAGFFGTGILYDGGGVDSFEGRNLSQGAGAFGIGALVSDASAVPPPAPKPEPDLAYERGIVGVPGTGAVPVRYDENDAYRAARQSQGFASTFGAGLLYDRAGSDTYRAGGWALHRPLLPDDFQALSQGFSIGFRPRAAGGIGVLIDDEGNDFYDAEVYSQGAAYWYSIGLLEDRAGNDRYIATQYSQGAGIHLAVGSLRDRGGDDAYIARFGVTQGTGHDLSVGMLIDDSGNDDYLVDGGQGVTLTNSVGLFLDRLGDDLYATSGFGQGAGNWARGFAGAAIFLDLEGKDTYPRGAAGADAAAWSSDLYAVGIDLDRDVVLPAEAIPEPVLTREDSLRSVKELFDTASLWEVGSAREKVRRARKALLAKGIEAVRYATSERMGDESGLEYRALVELGQAFPDSFAARILPRLDDPRLPVQRNVIALLGELKRREAREPLARLLRNEASAREHAPRVIQALGRIGDPAAAPTIRPYLADPIERRRLAAIGALAALRDTTSIPALAARLGDPLLTVRSASSSALRGFGAAAVGPVAGAFESGAADRPVALRTLAEIAAELPKPGTAEAMRARARVREILMNGLERPAGEMERSADRAAAVRGLLRLGDEPTVAFVDLRMQDESDPLVRRTYEYEKERMAEAAEAAR